MKRSLALLAMLLGVLVGPSSVAALNKVQYDQIVAQLTILFNNPPVTNPPTVLHAKASRTAARGASRCPLGSSAGWRARRPRGPKAAKFLPRFHLRAFC
jgi:hypothetical protein